MEGHTYIRRSIHTRHTREGTYIWKNIHMEKHPYGVT